MALPSDLNTRLTYTGDASTTSFTSPSFNADVSDICVYVDGVLKNTPGDYTLDVGLSQVNFVTAPATGTFIELLRNTEVSVKLVDFTDASVNNEADMDKMSDQFFQKIQELFDAIRLASLSSWNVVAGNWDALSKKIINLADPTDAQDAASKAYVDATATGAGAGIVVDTREVNTGVGLSGGGDLSANRTHDLDINGLTQDGSPAGADDFVATYDDDAGTIKKVLLNDLPSSGGGINNVVEDLTPAWGGPMERNGKDIVDANGNEILSFSEDSAAVNEIDISNADTTVAPVISAKGDDTNIDLFLTAKGTGNVAPQSDLVPAKSFVLLRGASIASAAALPVNVDGNSHDVTGTVTVTSLVATKTGTFKRLKFDAILVLTHNGTSLILPAGGANITTAAGDVGLFEDLGGGNWRCVVYTRANGTSLVSVVGSARIKSGFYTGDGTTSQPIVGVGFKPIYLTIAQKITVDDGQGFRRDTWTDVMDDNAAGGALKGNRFFTNQIISLDTDGFTVDDDGVDDHVNSSGIVYNFLAIG